MKFKILARKGVEKKIKITDSMTKYKIKANSATYTFNEDIHKIQTNHLEAF